MLFTEAMNITDGLRDNINNQKVELEMPKI